MRITTLLLDIPLHPADLSAFRACMAETAGLDREIFHNHDNRLPDQDYYHWDYPLVQYGIRRGRPAVIGIEAGSDAVRQHLFLQIPDTIQIKGRTLHVYTCELKEQKVAVELLEEPCLFGLFGWLALNADNYRRWKEARHEEEQRSILNNALTGHLRCFAKAAGIEDVTKVKGEVLQVDRQKKILWHEVPLVRFDVLATASISIPSGIGLGRNAAFGFGEVLSPDAYHRAMHFSSLRTQLAK